VPCRIVDHTFDKQKAAQRKLASLASKVDVASAEVARAYAAKRVAQYKSKD
jgi:hypothetical protein